MEKGSNILYDIDNFCTLAEILDAYLRNEKGLHALHKNILDTAIQKACKENGFFTCENIYHAMQQVCSVLQKKNLMEWLRNYYDISNNYLTKKNIGVVMAGNIPLVGFHDFLCVLLSGHCFLGKTSHHDAYLLPAIAEILFSIDPKWKKRIMFTSGTLTGFDAIIATGSNNSARYFEYYFGKYPHIIRNNRTSMAVLTGHETKEELKLLADDVFQYFGLGCRNVNKLWVPLHYDFLPFLESVQKYVHYSDHNKFRNNYDYYKTIYLLSSIPFYDGGFFIMLENSDLHCPVAVLNFQYYINIDEVKSMIISQESNLQCIVGNPDVNHRFIPFGSAQQPGLSDYADNIDTMHFLKIVDKNSS